VGWKRYWVPVDWQQKWHGRKSWSWQKKGRKGNISSVWEKFGFEKTDLVAQCIYWTSTFQAILINLAWCRWKFNQDFLRVQSNVWETTQLVKPSENYFSFTRFVKCFAEHEVKCFAEQFCWNPFSTVWYRAGLSKCVARLEALLRGPARVRGFSVWPIKLHTAV